MSDKNFKVKNGIDAVGPITISPSSNSIDGLIINTPIGGKSVRFIRNGTGEVGSIDEWGGLVTSGGIQVAQPWYTRSPGIEAQSFFWAGSTTRSAAGFGGTSTGTSPVIYISSHNAGTNDLTQWLKPDNTILAKVDYLGSIYNSGLVEIGRTKTSDGSSAINFITVGSYAGAGGQSTISRGSGYNGSLVLTNYGNGSIILNQGGTDILTITNTGSATFSSDLTVTGNFTVNGTTTNLNSTNLVVEDKNIIIADVATPTDTTADGAGITIKGATDKTFNWVNSTKSFTSSEPLIINNSSTTTVPLIAKGYASQTANHFEVQDSAGNKMFVVNPPAGTLQPLEYFFVRPGGTGGTATIGTNSYSFRVVAAGGNSVSLGTPGGGTSLQVVASDTFNRYKIIGSGTGIAPTFTTDGNDADVNMYITAKGAGKIGINTTSPTGYVHAVSSSSSTVGLIVEGASGQTSTNIFEVQRAGGGDASFSVSHNYINLNRNTTAAASMTVYGANSGAVPLYVKGRASQTADLVSIQQSSGFALARFDANANIILGNTNVDSNNYLSFIKAGGGVGGYAGIRFGNDADGTNQHTLTINTATADLTLEHKNVVSRFIVRGAASQTADLQVWQTNDGTNALRMTAYGKLFSNYLQANYGILTGGATYTGGYNFISNPTFATTDTTLIVKSVASQTADVQQWQDGSGNVLATLKASGTLVINSTNSVNSSFGITMVNKTIAHYYTGNNTSVQTVLNLTRGNTTGAWMNISTTGDAANGVASIDIRDGANTQLFSVGYTGNTSIKLQSTSSVGLIIKAYGSQTANFQEWQDSAGTVLAKIDASGNITDASNTKWLSPIGSGSDDAPIIQALIDAGKKEIRLGSGQWTFSTRIKVPNGVTLRGIGSSTTSTTGTRVNAVALIASEGTVRDITFTGASENSQNEIGGGIAVLGGRVINCSVTDSRWVLAPTRQPHGYLKNFMSRMQGGYGSVKVAILGDSLSENTNTTSWYGYLFNSSTAATGYYLGSYFGHPISTSEVDNMAIGGQGAYLLSAQLAMTKETLRTGAYVNQVLDGDRVSSSPFFNRNYNLAIIAIGQNGGEDWKAHLEYVVKTIRDKGIDVILLTQNPAAGNPTSRAGDEYYYRSLAETYGCLLVDTQAYYRLEVEFGRALGTTADLFGDSIHQSTQGHQLYAKAILNGILDYDSTIAVPASNTVSTRSYSPAQTDRATALAGLNTYYLVKKPDPLRDISGVTYTTATDTSIRNPIYGRGTTTNSVATIASGGYAMWGVEYATAAYIIYRENATANTLTVALQGGGSTLATLTTGVTNGRTSVQKVMLAGGYPSNRAIRITNTSGNAIQIYGVVFETHADVAFNRNTDGSYPGLTLSGTWSSGYFLDMASYGGLPTPYTSTVNDYVTFKFYGDGLRFTTSYGKNSGIIQVKIDDTTYTAVDTYNNISEYGTYTHFYGGLDYGLHTATITLTGANASVTNNLGDGARFGLHRISAVRSSWYLTQDQQFAPNSDVSSKVTSLSSPVISSAGGSGATDLIIKSATTVSSGTVEKFVSFKNSANNEIAYISDNSYGTSIAQFSYLYTNAVQGWNSSGGVISIAANAPVTITPQNSSQPALAVKGAASQTADLQRWINSAGTTMSKVDSNGYITSGIFYANSNHYAGYQIIGGRAIVTLDSTAAMGMVNWNTGLHTLQLRNVSSQTADSLRIENSSGTAIVRIDASGNLSAVTKSFDIPHPTKENMRLRYASLEGSENGVYIRGTAESNIIELPDYWTGLVHKNSITVSLTAVGSAQNIYVEKIENNKVYIGGELTKAFFTVYGERKDIDKLTVEY